MPHDVIPQIHPFKSGDSVDPSPSCLEIDDQGINMRCHWPVLPVATARKELLTIRKRNSFILESEARDQMIIYAFTWIETAGMMSWNIPTYLTEVTTSTSISGISASGGKSPMSGPSTLVKTESKSERAFLLLNFSASDPTYNEATA
ncbi:hypothetical protein CSAL01_12603 [Colletotrichum salicis]|uniref:Uncharacterized protein n=1 Tax=Colletotrichum salicis TaxID=1209931 RepID=A0A135UWK9_9PEZI|nr:hypothetical protein CSAL01_12603 [Colletotrichum salicis]